MSQMAHHNQLFDRKLFFTKLHYDFCLYSILSYSFDITKWLANLGQIVDGNAKTDVSNRREPGMFCGEAEQPQTFISETSYVKIIFFAENYTDQVKTNANALLNSLIISLRC